MLKEILAYKFFKTGITAPYLIFFVTGKCNFRCPHCFNLGSLGSGQSDLSLDEIKQLAPTIGRLLWLAVSGGEPFLREDLSEIVEVMHRHTRFRRLNLPTNGYLSEQIARTVSEMLPRVKCEFTVTVSIDGLRERHDAIKDMPGSFDAACETVLRLKELQKRHPHLSVKVNTVLSAKNKDQVSELGRYVREKLAPDFHAFELVRGATVSAPCDRPVVEDCRRIYEEVRAVWRLYPQYETGRGRLTNALAKGLYKYLHKVHLESMAKNVQAVPCLAGRISAVIYEDGRFALCELLPPVCNLRECGLSFQNAWHCEAAEKQRRMIRDGACHCTHTCFQFTNVLFNPARYVHIALNAIGK